MTSAVGNLSAVSYSSYSSCGSNGKLYVPVKKAVLIYSHFDHVSGVAAKAGQKGVSISKIKILNTLIDRLSTMKSEPKELFTDLNNDQLDAVIKSYQQQIKQAAIQTPYIIAGTKPQSGMLFAIDA